MRSTRKATPGVASEIGAALDVVIDTLSAFDLKDDPRGQVRRAADALDRVLSLTSEGSSPGFRDRVTKARHCLRMGKPRQCLKMVEELKADLQGTTDD